MSPTLLVLLLLSQAAWPDDPPAGTREPPLAPEGASALLPGAFASVGLEVDNAH